MKIYNIYGAEIYSSEKETIKEALEEAVAKNAYLENANLKNAYLYNANLENANLKNANLYNANLENAYLYNANLENANLYNAYLENAKLYNANLENANLPIYCKWAVTIINEKIKIGCKEMSIKEWDLFFKSDEEFDTKRDTNDFIRIEANYKAAKSYLKHLKKAI